MKSTFIKHDLRRLHQCPATTTCKVASASACGRAKSIADTSTHLWSFIRPTPYTCNTTQKEMCVKTAINAWLK